MSFQTSSVSATINFAAAGLYYFSRSKILPIKQLRIHLSGITLASIISSTRPYTENQLKRWFEKRHLDAVYLSASILVMGVTTHYSKLPFKVNALSIFVFAGVQLITHKLTTHYFREELDAERRAPTHLTPQQLNYYKQNSLQGEYYLTEQLFRQTPLPSGVECSAYLYVLLNKFMILLCSNEQSRFFMHPPTIDGTEVNRLWRDCPQTLTLSQQAHEELKALSQRVHVKHLDGREEDTEWSLPGVPPFICLQGQWNQVPEPYGTTVDWEALILRQTQQQHEAFEISLCHPTWEHIPQNPTMRGLSFNHSQTGFNIWVHERNPNAFECQREDLADQIVSKRGVIDFVRRFEEAAFTFGITQSLPMNRHGTAVDQNALEAWKNLTQQIPFPHDSNTYQGIPDLCRDFRRDPSQQQILIDHFQIFFEGLPWETHFATDFVLCEKFEQAHQEFRTAGNNLVPDQRGYIDVNKLKEWLVILKRTHFYCGETEDLTELINWCDEYIAINHILRNQNRGTQEEREAHRKRRAELTPKLQPKFQWFFQTYQQQISEKGKFLKDVQSDVVRLEEQQRRLEIYAFCEQGGDFDTSGILLTDAAIDPLKLKECQAVLDLYRPYNEAIPDRLRTLKIQSQTYLHQQQADMVQPLIDEYRWFFSEFIPNLDGEKKPLFSDALATFANTPRSHLISTAQLAYEATPSTRDLHLMIRLNRAEQVLALVRYLDSHIMTVQGNVDLPQAYFEKFQDFYGRVRDFVLRKSQELEIEREFGWELNHLGDLVQFYTDTPSDGSKYRFHTCDSRNSRDLFRLMKESQQTLAALYTSVNQTNRENYLSSPFLAEESTLFEEFYTVANELLRIMEIPLGWNEHHELQNKTDETTNALRELANSGRYVIYKRIGHNGMTASDLVRRGDTSHLASLNTYHNAI